MIVSLFVAMSENRVIGRDGQLPWRLPADLQYFRRNTMGKPIVMGRRTFESIGRPLPGRTNIVVTSDRAYQVTGCIIVHSIDDALLAAGAAEEVMLIGGAVLYQQVLSKAIRIYLTLIHADIVGDTYFPELDSTWLEIWREDHPADSDNAYSYSFILLQREEADKRLSKQGVIR